MPNLFDMPLFQLSIIIIYKLIDSQLTAAAYFTVRRSQFNKAIYLYSCRHRGDCFHTIRIDFTPGTLG